MDVVPDTYKAMATGDDQSMREELRNLRAEIAMERDRRQNVEQALLELRMEVQMLKATPSGRDAQPYDTLQEEQPPREFSEEALLMMQPLTQTSSRELEVGNRVKSGYERLNDMSGDNLKGVLYDYEDLPEDMWGMTILVLTRDVAEIEAGDNVGFHYVRAIYVAICGLLNLVLQLAVLAWVDAYIMGNSVWVLQLQYAKFHSEVFTAEGKFKPDVWHKWDGPREELCGAVINKKLFLGGILFLWVGRMLGEFKDNQRLARTIWKLPSAPPGARMKHCVLDNRKPAEGEDKPENEIIALTCCIRFLVFIVVIIPKFCICIILAGLGAHWLSATTCFSDLILNALALEFIIDIDANILDFFLPRRLKTRADATKFSFPRNLDETSEEKEATRQFDYIRNAIYFVVCWIITIALVRGQQVLPDSGLDIEQYCEDWYMDQYNPKCNPFERDCFPFGRSDARYEPMQPPINHWGHLAQ
jgi:hypothetical protein